MAKPIQLALDEMELYETYLIHAFLQIRKVPNGWIYEYMDVDYNITAAVFVPEKLQ